MVINIHCYDCYLEIVREYILSVFFLDRYFHGKFQETPFPQSSIFTWDESFVTRVGVNDDCDFARRRSKRNG